MQKKLIPLTKNICLRNYTYFSYSYAMSKYKLKIATPMPIRSLAVSLLCHYDFNVPFVSTLTTLCRCFCPCRCVFTRCTRSHPHVHLLGDTGRSGRAVPCSQGPAGIPQPRHTPPPPPRLLPGRAETEVFKYRHTNFKYRTY